MPYSTPVTAVTGAVATAGDWNTGVRDNMGFLSAPPGAKVTHNASQSVTSGVLFVMAFNAERWDNDAMHSTTTNNSRLTIKTAGRYLIVASVGFESNAAGARAATIRKNGNTPIATVVTPAAGGGNRTILTPSTIAGCSVNDYFEVEVYQDSLVALNVGSGAAEDMGDFAAQWLGF